MHGSILVSNVFVLLGGDVGLGSPPRQFLSASRSLSWDPEVASRSTFDDAEKEVSDWGLEKIQAEALAWHGAG